MKVLRTTGTEYLPDEFDFLAAIFFAVAGLLLEFVTSDSISPSKYWFNGKDPLHQLAARSTLSTRCPLRNTSQMPKGASSGDS
jgi:hypothetical protein